MKRVKGRGSKVEGPPKAETSGVEGPVTRRDAVTLLATVPLGLVLAWRPSRVQVQKALSSFLDPRPSTLDARFFTPHEYDTVRLLADLVIPRDERSGSSTDAEVPEFMDFMMADKDTPREARAAMREGLAWVDAECRRRFGRPFTECAGPERTALLDDIAWPARARPEMSHGAAFFSSFRDLTASGFWSSEMGVKDLQYRGNAFVPEWTGCPDAVLRKVGVRYEGF